MRNKTNLITQNAILVAIVFISVKMINIPTAIGGVINLSDSVILTISLIASTSSATLSSGLGSFIAEVMSPYAIFAPATLIIKGLMAFVSSTINKKVHIKNKYVHILVGFIAAEIIMIIGYFIFQAYFLDLGVYVASLDIINNVIQATLSIITAFILSNIILKQIRLSA